MNRTDAVRHCACGTRLARDNRTDRCSACTRAGRRHQTQPPDVPTGFWDHPELRRALAARDIGAVIRAYRKHPHHARPIRQESAAAWIGLSPTRLSRIENGEPVNDLAKLVRWAQLLRIPQHLLWFRMPDAGDPSQTAQPEQRHEQPSGGLHLQVVLDGRLMLVPLDWRSIATSDLASLLDRWIMDGARLSGADAAPVARGDMPISRRSLLLHGTAVFVFPALGPGEIAQVDKAMANPRRFLNGEVVGHLTRQLREAMADDGRQGPKKTLPVALGLLEAVQQVARDVKPDVRRRLLSMGAQAAEFAGWLYRDAQEPERAAFWRDRATEWAQEVNDTSMQGYILLKKAQAAYDERDALRMLTLSQAVQSGPWSLPVRVKAEAAQQEARAHAMLGVDDAEVDRKLDEAHSLLADGENSRGGEDALGSHYNVTLLAMQTAICHTEAGRPRRAADLYRASLSAHEFSPRDYGYFMSLMATSLGLAGEPDEAAHTALRSLTLAQETGSHRTLKELSVVVETLKPWKTRAAVRELREAVSAVTDSPR